MEHEVPLHPSSLTKWRQRVGTDEPLQGTIAIALKEKQVTTQELAQVSVDTTVQERTITHPTDSKLYHTARVQLAAAAAANNRRVRLRQGYMRVLKQVNIIVSR